MSQPPERPRNERPAIIDEVGAELRRLFEEAQAREHARGGRWRTRFPLRRWRPLAVFAVLLLGGTTAALAAAGVFDKGSPYGGRGYPETPTSNNGVASHGSVHLLALSVPDPQGGPAWGLRIQRTTRGLTCLAVGRLDHGTIGALGIDHAFHDDHRFHPLVVNTYEETNCTNPDGAGHAYLSVEAQAIPANALEGSCSPHSTSTPPAPRRPPAFRQHVPSIPSCPTKDMRNIYYGLLGPDAVSVSYTTPNGKQAVQRTIGSDGAYLVVGPAITNFCRRIGPAGGLGGVACGNGDISGGGLTAGLIRAVAYRNGTSCHPAQLVARRNKTAAQYDAQLRKRYPLVAKEQNHQRLTAAQRAQLQKIVRNPSFRKFFRSRFLPLLRIPRCPLVGFVAPPATHVTAADVATPITIKVGSKNPDCGRTRADHRICGWPEINVAVSFRSRVALPDISSHYEINERQTYTGPCRYGASGLGSSAPSATDIRAGEIVRMPLQVIDCPSVVHGDIVYNARKNTAYKPTQIPGFGTIDGVLVGTFTFHTP